MIKPYIRSVKLFEVQDLYGHHLLGLATLVYEPDQKIGSGPSRLDVRIVLDGNVEDDLTFKLDWSWLDPTSVENTPTRQVVMDLQQFYKAEGDPSNPDANESLMSPRALDSTS